MTMFTRLMIGISGAAVMLTMAACKPGAETPRGEAHLKVVATVGMIGDVVVEIGGDKVSVETLIGAGVDPHLYKPTVTDVKQLDVADIVFHNGLLLEGRMGDVLRKIGKPGKSVHAVAEESLAGQGYVVSDDGGHHDPHVWMDVSAWAKVAESIAAALAAKDPENALFYQERAAAYRERLDGLDAYARKTLAGIPRERRVLVTAHDAFGYMARAYGLEVRAVQGLSTESEAGLREINGLVDFLVERGVPAVFVESSVPTKAVEALIEGARSRGHHVRIGGELFSDAMGRAGTYEGTYIGMIDHNVTTIARALGGEAPEKGFQYKLSSSDTK
jgi:manganese/zinc/iron transport system substrate-binding protein